jgi:multidrug efflux pump subunit AcrA (membrane-fusion protein)
MVGMAVVPVNPVYTAQRGEVVKQLEFTGRVSPTTEKDLFFRTNGRIRRIDVKIDQMVKAGELLAELEKITWNVTGRDRSTTTAKVR